MAAEKDCVSPRNDSVEESGSPQRLLSKSYPPQRPAHRHGTSADIKLSELMDEDEVRWMSTMESSRAATPTQGAPVVKPLEPPPQPDLGYSRNVTPPLSPLSDDGGTSAIPGQRYLAARLTALPQRTKTLDPQTFAKRVFLAAKADLLYNYDEPSLLPWRNGATTRGAIDITTLQKMHKHVVQQKLVSQVRALGKHQSWLEIGIGETVHEYCQILADLEFMHSYARTGTQSDPFLITTQRPLEAQLLEESGLARQTPGATRHRHAVAAGRIRGLARSSPRWILLKRLVVVLCIAAAVLLPFLVTVFTAGYLPRIVVVCACIAVFAVAAALVNGSRRHIMAPVLLTLIYAGGLVVFLGTSPARYPG